MLVYSFVTVVLYIVIVLAHSGIKFQMRLFKIMYFKNIFCALIVNMHIMIKW